MWSLTFGGGGIYETNASKCGGWEMKFKMQDYVRITSNYPYDRILRGETGNIIALPTGEQTEEYLVKLDGEIAHPPFSIVRQIWVSVNWLEPANQIRPK